MTVIQDKGTSAYLIKQVKLAAGKESEQNNNRTFQEDR